MPICSILLKSGVRASPKGYSFVGYRVSVIVPAKNAANTIGACLSALNQIDFPRDGYEVMVIDNGSDDDTVSIASTFGVRVLQFPNTTVSALRNLGAKKARGDYLAFVDADVVVHKSWLKNALRVLNDSRIGCVGCSPEIPLDSTWVERTWHVQVTVRAHREERSWLPSMNMVMPSKVFHEVGGFNEALVTCEDVDLGYRLHGRYLIVADKSIRAVHLGEAKTLWELLVKESWRGMGSLAGLSSHGLVFHEIPSHIVSLMYLGIIAVLPLSLLMQHVYLLLIVVLMSCIFPFLKASMLSWRLERVSPFFELFVVWFAYGLARGIGLLRWIRETGVRR